MNKAKITYATSQVPMKCEDCRESGITQRASYLCAKRRMEDDALPTEGYYLCEDCMEAYEPFRGFTEIWMINESVFSTGEWNELLLVHPA